MKIGILTYHFVSNFGANLQTLSTFEKIKNEGHTPYIINWEPEDLKRYYIKTVSNEQNQAFNEFSSSRYTSLTRICHDSLDIAAVIDEEDIDLVVIGSDAVLTYLPYTRRIVLTKRGPKILKPCIDSEFPNAFWGDFMDFSVKQPRLALMSASAQNTPYKSIYFRKDKFRRALGRFDYISVRDIWTQKMVSFLTKKSIVPPITPDPVFSFNQNVTNQLDAQYIRRRFNLPENYALLSAVNNSLSNDWKRHLAVEFNKKGITLFELPQANKKFNNVLKNYIPFPIAPMEWYALIKYSCAYIGELMHPILVSLHNSVPIYAIDTYGFKKSRTAYNIDSESSKTYQILKRFQLLDNYCNVNSEQSIKSPSEVARLILEFDRERCRKESDIMLTEYNNMMESIINL